MTHVPTRPAATLALALAAASSLAACQTVAAAPPLVTSGSAPYEPAPQAAPAAPPAVLAPPATERASLSPAEIVAAAPAADWRAIPAEDLLVMQLAPDREGRAREIVLQLIGVPYSEGWTANIRTLARAQWYDGLAIVRVQDNYVVQWGDPDGEDAGKAKPLPAGLRVMRESDYVRQLDAVAALIPPCQRGSGTPATWLCDPYAAGATFRGGWPIATDGAREWPVHCYGMVGVGRNYAPDTGSGAELYTVIGHAPRHLDRNIAVVGRVVSGIEHLSSLPRGTGDLGFYETAGERTAIRTVRLASELPPGARPRFEYLDTGGVSFARYAAARANRSDPFFTVPAGGVDVCNVPVPVRRVAAP